MSKALSVQKKIAIGRTDRQTDRQTNPSIHYMDSLYGWTRVSPVAHIHNLSYQSIVYHSRVSSILCYLSNVAKASLDDPFRPADQDKVHFGTPVFNLDRPKHSASVEEIRKSNRV